MNFNVINTSETSSLVNLSGRGYQGCTPPRISCSLPEKNGQINGRFPKWCRTFIEFSKFCEFRESDKSVKHELAQFKYPASHMCLAGAVVASWSLTQEVAGLSPFK